VHWSEDKNIRWKTKIPGRGHSTPVIWGEQIYLTTAIPTGERLEAQFSHAPGAHDNGAVTHRQKFVVLAINRRDGSIQWERTVHEALPHEAGHATSSLASASPVTDGEHVFAFFGSRGLYCLDRDGALVWKTDLGDMASKHGHGEGSSPALYGNTLIVNWDHEGQSFLVAFDKRTGSERWKVLRDELTSWATPVVVEVGGKPQVIVSGTNRIHGYDLDSGEVIWSCGGLSHNIVATPVAADGMLFAGSSYGTRALLAIRLEGATGDITGSDRVAWTHHKNTPYVPSPLLYGESLYFLKHYQGILSRLDTRTGANPTGPFRLEGLYNVYASPVGASNRIYITDRDGTTLVLRHATNPEVLARNHLDDRFSASAAIVGDALYLRGERHLYCIARH
jgi:outer membrane protein assembly factor BamB